MLWLLAYWVKIKPFTACSKYPTPQFPYLAAMLRFDSLTVTQFKNYPAASFSFTERIVGICGLNGIGKTNLLDALYYLCFTKSYFSSSDALVAQFNSTGFRLQGLARLPARAGSDGNDTVGQSRLSQNYAEDIYDIVCIYRGVGKKEVSVNGSEYDKFSQHIGRFPCVMIAPDDVELITGGGAERRKLLDMILGQMDGAYLQHLINYNKILQQRNSLLKRFADHGQTDHALLDVLDGQLVQPGQYIFQQRQQLTAALIAQVQQLYNTIANANETITLAYESQLSSSNFAELLMASRQKDLILQRTNTGIHKDDINIELNGQPFKNIASQGQRKSLLFALKLAEFELLRQNKGFAPILLLDDVFEKLDGQRMQNLLQHVCVLNQGQVFITDTHRERLEETLIGTGQPFQIIAL
jgi:DNA replication and repair protein RecF